ncbi:hypothetical protein BYT27DRAFT_7244534 [Phlegmacium glaucopus]|nr:hypothetical protein BYT27DRAFT_7244534 [Phlegmacium glaucopus]
MSCMGVPQLVSLTSRWTHCTTKQHTLHFKHSRPFIMHSFLALIVGIFVTAVTVIALPMGNLPRSLSYDSQGQVMFTRYIHPDATGQSAHAPPHDHQAAPPYDHAEALKSSVHDLALAGATYLATKGANRLQEMAAGG